MIQRYFQNSTYHKRANALLFVNIVLYGLVFVGQFFTTAVWFDALYWCVQSALIGSVADWFAVTALFRKPLGFPYHTALIPNNKDRLIRGITAMVESKILTKKRCESMVRHIEFLPMLDRYLMTESGQRALRLLLHQAIHAIWHAKSYDEWAFLGSKKIRQWMSERSLVPALQHVLLDLCEHNRYESMVVQVLSELQRQIQHPAIVGWLSAIIDEEVQRKKHSFLSDLLLSFSEATDIINPHDLANSILHELYDMLEIWKQPNNEERIVWLRQWVEPIQSLGDNRDVCAALDVSWLRWIEGQPWESIIKEHVCPYIGDFIMNGNEQGDTPAALVEQIILTIWARHYQDEALRKRIETTLHRISLYLLEQGYSLLGLIIGEVLQGFSTEKLIAFMESKIDDDLSWIRINGSIVGGVCGLLVWCVLHFIYEPLLIYWHIWL